MAPNDDFLITIESLLKDTPEEKKRKEQDERIVQHFLGHMRKDRSLDKERENPQQFNSSGEN
jgi:hypothetical protein